MGTALHVDDVTVNFGGVTAVSQVSLLIEEGHRWAVIGPNGAGKTTLFRTISGEVQPTRGSVKLFGSDMSRSASYKKAQSGIGRTYQVTELFMDLSVEDNLVIAAQAVTKDRFRFWSPVRVKGELDEKVSWALDAVDLASNRYTRVCRRCLTALTGS